MHAENLGRNPIVQLAGKLGHISASYYESVDQLKAMLCNCYSWMIGGQASYAEFLLEIDLKILLRKTGARLNFKIELISLHIDPELPL